MRNLVIGLLVAALAPLALIEPSASTPPFAYALVEEQSGIDDPTPATFSIAAAADAALTWFSVHAATDSATPTDDQTNSWSTPATQIGSGHIIIASATCGTTASTYAVSLDIALRTFILKFIQEWNGIPTTDCIDDDVATGNENPSDTDPLTGATVTCSGACLIAGLGVSSANLTASDTEIAEETSVSTILGNAAHKRLSGAGDGNLAWAMSAGAPTLSLSLALKETVAGGATRRPCSIIGGGRYGCDPFSWLVQKPFAGARLMRTWVVLSDGRVFQMKRR